MTAAPNAALAYAVLDQIDAHPELWNQMKWLQKTDCGTAACFAGWACLLAGDTEPIALPVGDSTEFVIVGERTEGLTPENAQYQSVPRRAAELLGIEYDGSGETDGHELFEGANDRIALRELVAEYFGPRPAVTS